MKKIMGPIVFITIIMANVSFARAYDFELNAGHSALEARFNATAPIEKGFLTTGLGAIYRDDHYTIGDMKLALTDQILVPELELSLGFKGVLGDIEEDHKDGDLMAIGFFFSGKYTITESIIPIPVGISVGLSLAPDTLCFSDSERYLEARTSLDFSIVRNGAIVLGYRYIEARFDDNYGHWEMSDDMLFVGCQLRF